MHACNSDVHMTLALGLLATGPSTTGRTILFLFQPAEENEAGGMLMYEDGAFETGCPINSYAGHVRPDLAGEIATNQRSLVGTCEVKLDFFKGKGGHAPSLMSQGCPGHCQLFCHPGPNHC